MNFPRFSFNPLRRLTRYTICAYTRIMKYRKVQPIKEVSQDVEKRCMGMHIRKAARLLAVFYDDHLRPVDLKGTQFTLLNEIFLNALITIGQLAE